MPPLKRYTQTALAIGLAVLVWSLAGAGPESSYAAKPKAKAKTPDLKIVSVDPAPLPFVVPAETPLILTIMVELPKKLPDDAVLDVTTLITSPSKLSIRLLTSRQMVTGKRVLDAEGGNGGLPMIEVVQTWDGTDHTKQVVSDGTYDFQVQAKLMVMGKNGPLTRTTSWRKRGSFEVRTR